MFTHDFNPIIDFVFVLNKKQNGARNNAFFLTKVKERSDPYFTVMDSVFNLYDLPLQLKYLAVIESELKFERAVVLAELTTARRTVEANERQIEALRAEFLRNADESQQVALAAYREGATDLLHLIDAQHTQSISLTYRADITRQQRI